MTLATAGLTEKVRELVEKYHFIRGELTDCSQRQDKTQTLKCNFLEVCEKRLKKCERSVEQQIQQVDSCRHRLIGLVFRILALISFFFSNETIKKIIITGCMKLNDCLLRTRTS